MMNAWNRNDILDVLRAEDGVALFEEADRVRREQCGDVVYIRAIVEFSNNCARDCLYCGLRRSQRDLRRYRMSHAAILECVARLVNSGLRTVVLQSGDDFSYTADDLCAIVRDIKGVKPELAVTLSVGERPLDNYRALRDAGADRFLLKHETINPELYRKLHPGQESSERLKRLEELRRLGYQVGTGFIVGLPGQTFEDLADEIEFMRSFQPDMAGVGPFMPQCETPLASVPPGDTELALKCVALTRIVTGNAHLPATTALGSSDPENGYRRALRAGCNVLMFDGTPEAYREAYRIYDNKVQTDCERAVALIDEAGLVPSRERGDSLKETRRTGSPAGG